jgi:hypothetical protein
VFWYEFEVTGPSNWDSALLGVTDPTYSPGGTYIPSAGQFGVARPSFCVLAYGDSPSAATTDSRCDTPSSPHSPLTGWQIPGHTDSVRTTQLLGDVTGDGRADAVTLDPSNGWTWVAVSTGGRFGMPSLWSANGTMPNATRYFLADVNGDHRADLVAYSASSGSWYVMLSTGTSFGAPTQWAYNEGVGSTNQFVADVNGDHMADVVTFTASTGDWYVDTSSGSGFWGPPQQWIAGHGVGSTTQLVGDFNGDGRADAAVYFASNGNWYVGLSSGSSFNYPGQWSAAQGTNSLVQLVGDVNGDGRADIAYYYSDGHWTVGTSSGSGFWTPTVWAYNQGTGSTRQFIADVNGDGMADVVTYFESSGAWDVDESAGSAFWGPPTGWMPVAFGDNYG